MPELTVSEIVFLIAVVAYTIATSVTDLRTRKIPNRLTAPMCLAGFAYQGFFFGLPGIGNGALGFAVGFGLLFLLWMIGSAGGGDVKLIGGLSVWLGASLTLRVLLCSLIFVMLGTMAMMIYGVMSQGFSKTRKQLLQKKSASEKSADSVDRRQKRRVMAFAVPVALATWCVLLVFRTQW